MPKLPQCYTGPWPELLMEAISYHEAGHTLMGLHHGLTVKEVWAGDGRPCEWGEHPAIHGMTTFNRGPRTMLADVFLGTAPEYSERMAPNYDKFKKIHTDHPDFYIPDDGSHFKGDYFNGTHNDIEESFNKVAPLYWIMGLSYEEARQAFDHEFRIPAENVMKSYEEQIHALAGLLMKKKLLKGEEVHKIVCGKGGPSMPGCQRNPMMSDVLTERLKRRGFGGVMVIMEIGGRGNKG